MYVDKEWETCAEESGSHEELTGLKRDHKTRSMKEEKK